MVLHSITTTATVWTFAVSATLVSSPLTRILEAEPQVRTNRWGEPDHLVLNYWSQTQGALCSELFSFWFPATRLCGPNLPRCVQVWQIWMQLEARHTAAHDVHWRLPACHAGGDGGAGGHSEHEDLQHQRHELHPRGTGPGAPETDARAWGHLRRWPGATGYWYVAMDGSCSVVNSSACLNNKYLQQNSDNADLSLINFFFCSWQLANEFRWLQCAEGLELEARLRPARAGPDNAQLL